MSEFDRRSVLRWCAGGVAATVAGCTGGGGSSGPPTVTGLAANCTSVEAPGNPPWGDLVVYPNPTENDIEINIDHGYPEGGLYLKRNGEPVDGWNHKRAPGGRLSLDRGDDVVIVVQAPDGSCTRWAGVAADLDR